MSESFTAWLRARSEPDWTATISHPFTEALFDGLVPEESMRSYLVQDYQFVDGFLALLGAALASAEQYPSRLSIASSITVVTSEENTYFRRAFDALGVPESERRAPALNDATTAFRDLMSEATRNGTYPEILTVLTVAEWSYLEWAMRAPATQPENFVHAEWISLHNNPGFQEWVGWLLAELDRIGERLNEREQARCLRLFQRATSCELDFFDAHFSRAVTG